MNNLKNKKNISLVFLILILSLFIFIVYFFNLKIRSYKTGILNDYNKLAELENQRSTFNTYKKILTNGSTESAKIQKFILSNDRKDVLNLINQLEEYAKRVGLTENNISPIVSVATRDNNNIKKYNAGDLIINIKLIGDQTKIDGFINILNNLPMVSYVEKIDMRFDNATGKNNVNITLIIYQRK